MKALLGKILQFQKKVEAVEKDSVNPFLKNRYADINQFIETVKPVLNEVGLVLMQPLVQTLEGKPALQTIIADPETGEQIESTIPLMEVSTAQQLGSVISYTRRYALQSMMFLQTTDDDGNAASGTKESAEPFPSVCTKCGKEFSANPSWVKVCNECKK